MTSVDHTERLHLWVPLISVVLFTPSVVAIIKENNHRRKNMLTVNEP